MNLNSVEWSQAQELLLALVRVLTPLTGRTESISSFLNFRFYCPSPHVEIELHRNVSVLTTLCSVQAQVKEWVGETAEGKRTDVKPELPLAKQAQRLDVKPELPLEKQAQRLIAQVQNAIGKLCNSKHIKNPEAAPVRETLQTLKPNLDRIIEIVAEIECRQPSVQTKGKRGGDVQVLKEPFTSTQQKQESEPPRLLERTSLPIVPFVSDPRTLIPPARKKKKKKGLWQREKEDLT